MAPVPKGHQPVTLQSARGIKLANAAPKLVGKVLRAAALPVLLKVTNGAQLGSIPGGGTSMPSAAVRAFIARGASRCTSVAVLFADLRAAFYSVLTEEVIGEVMTATTRAAALQHLGFSAAQEREFTRRFIEGQSLLEKGGLAPEWRAMITDWHRAPYFTVRGGRHHVATRLGAVPGEPLADLAFSLCYEI